MNTATQYIKDKTGRFQGSVSLRPPVQAVPKMPTKPIETVPVVTQQDKDFLARWDLSTASDGLAKPLELESEKQRRNMKILGVSGFITVNVAYTTSLAALTSSSLPGPVAAGIAVITLPIAIALAAVSGMPYSQAKKAKVVS